MNRIQKPESPLAQQREIDVACRHPRLRCSQAAVRALIATLDAHAAEFRGGCPRGELSIVLMPDAELSRLHATFLNDPAKTDVITFEGDAASGTAGEICVSVDTAHEYARKNGHPFATELSLYVVHGWLHLAGYDDLQPIKKRLMRRAEKRALKLLQNHRKIPAFELRSATRRPSRS